MSFVLSEITEVSAKQEDASSASCDPSSKQGSMVAPQTTPLNAVEETKQERSTPGSESFLNDSFTAIAKKEKTCDCGGECISF